VAALGGDSAHDMGAGWATGVLRWIEHWIPQDCAHERDELCGLAGHEKTIRCLDNIGGIFFHFDFDFRTMQVSFIRPKFRIERLYRHRGGYDASLSRQSCVLLSYQGRTDKRNPQLSLFMTSTTLGETNDEGPLDEQYVQDAFHSYLKSSLAQAKAERLLDVEVLSSAEGDLMITGMSHSRSLVSVFTISDQGPRCVSSSQRCAARPTLPRCPSHAPAAPESLPLA
jgi:hypothetical protein